MPLSTINFSGNDDDNTIPSSNCEPHTAEPGVALPNIQQNPDEPHGRHDMVTSRPSNRGPPRHRRSLSISGPPNGCIDFLNEGPSITSLPTTTTTSAEGFCHPPWPIPTPSDLSIVPIRSPLRPTIRFGGVSRYSYYSTGEVSSKQKQSITVTVTDLDDDPEHVDCSINWALYSCLACSALLNLICGMAMFSCSSILPFMAENLNLATLQALWIPVSFLLVCALIQPLAMRLSHVFGCKPLLLFGLALFTIGSIGSALSQDLTSILISRCYEGAGCGTICVLTQLSISQLAPAEQQSRIERAIPMIRYLGAAVGPILGGVLGQTIGWRSMFFIQVNFGGVGFVTMALLLRLPYSGAKPFLTWLLKIDFAGWILLCTSAVSVGLALSWGGNLFPWTSWHVLTPLLFGSLSSIIWINLTTRIHDPILPLTIFRDLSAAATCFGTLIHGMLFACFLYATPFLFRDAFNLNPATIGIALSSATLTLIVTAITTSAFLPRTGFRIPVWLGWTLTTLGTTLGALLCTNQSAPPREVSPGAIIAAILPSALLTGAGLGLLSPALAAALGAAAATDDETIHAAPLRSFLLALGHALGVAAGVAATLLNGFARHADAVAVDADAWALAMRDVWIVMAGLAGLALVTGLAFTRDRRVGSWTEG